MQVLITVHGQLLTAKLTDAIARDVSAAKVTDPAVLLTIYISSLNSDVIVIGKAVFWSVGLLKVTSAELVVGPTIAVHPGPTC